jgi:guanylate kinase
MDGKLIVVSAPSGSGKTSIVKQILNTALNIEFSVSACSRPPRKGEVHGKDYYFLTVEDFRNKISRNEFIEWEEVYPGSFYGTLKSEANRIWARGNHVIFDVDVIGGLNIKEQFNDRCLALFIQAPGIQELEKRLRSRATDNEETIKKRVAKASEELAYASRFDKIIVNRDLDAAVNETYETIKNFLN